MADKQKLANILLLVSGVVHLVPQYLGKYYIPMVVGVLAVILALMLLLKK